jgi:hypothetical protein
MAARDNTNLYVLKKKPKIIEGNIQNKSPQS